MNKPNSDEDLPVHFPWMDAEMARLVVHNTSTGLLGIQGVRSNSAAHLAASVRDLPLLRYVVEHAGRDCLKAQDDMGITPLLCAVMKRTASQEDTELEEFIVEQAGTSQILMLNNKEVSPFHYACRLENLNLLQMFLAHLPEPPKPDHVLIRVIIGCGTYPEIPHSNVNPFLELVVMLMKAQVLTEKHLISVTSKEDRERVIQLLQAGRKKSANSSVLRKREATEANVFSSPSPPRKNHK